MDNKTKHALINELARASSSQRPVTVKNNGKSVTVVWPISDHQEFYAERERKLHKIKMEMNSLLAFIRSRLKYQRPEEVEAELAAHRQKIKQEMNNLDDTL